MELLMDMDGWEASSLQEKFQGGVLEIWNFSFNILWLKFNYGYVLIMVYVWLSYDVMDDVILW